MQEEDLHLILMIADLIDLIAISMIATAILILIATNLTAIANLALTAISMIATAILILIAIHLIAIANLVLTATMIHIAISLTATAILTLNHIAAN